VSADPLAAIVAELDRAGIPYMLAGSFASSWHGSPRTTHDIDVVIDPTRDRLDRFVRELDRERYYVAEEAALEAWRRRGTFNVVDYQTGWKVDLILRKDRAFSRSEFDRRIRVNLAARSDWTRSGGACSVREDEATGRSRTAPDPSVQRIRRAS